MRKYIIANIGDTMDNIYIYIYMYVCMLCTTPAIYTRCREQIKMRKSCFLIIRKNFIPRILLPKWYSMHITEIPILTS